MRRRETLGDFSLQQPAEKVGVWSNFRRDVVFRRTAMTENLDVTPSFHFLNGLLTHPMCRHRSSGSKVLQAGDLVFEPA